MDGRRDQRRPTSEDVGRRVFEGIAAIVGWAGRADVRRRLVGSSGHVLPVVEVELLRALTADGAMRVSELAERQGVDKSTVAPPLNRLEQRGLVARRTDPRDGRAVLVAATAAGRRTRRDMDRVGARVVEELLEDWPSTDRETLAALLERLTHRLGAAPAGRSSGPAGRDDGRRRGEA